MDRIWSIAGEKYTRDDHVKYISIIESLKWNRLPYETGFMQGEAMKKAIEKLKITHATRVAESSELAPLGLIAVEGMAGNDSSAVRFYYIDDGLELIPILYEFIPAWEVQTWKS